jgi:hypothetical protein
LQAQSKNYAHLGVASSLGENLKHKSVNWTQIKKIIVLSVFRIQIHIDFGQLDPDPDHGGQKWHIKIEKGEEISCFEVLDVIF